MNNIQLSASLVLDTSHFTKQLAAVTATMRNFSATAGHTDHGLVNVSQQNAQTIRQHTKSTLVEIEHLSSGIRQLQTDSQASSTALQQDLQAIRQQTKSALAEIDSLSSGIRQLHANIQSGATGLQPAITHSQQLNNQIKQGSTYSREMASGLDQVQESLRRAVSIAGGLYVLDKAVDAVRQFPALGIKSAASLETMRLGLAGTLASMGQIEGKAISIAEAQQIAATLTATLQQKAMETAASTEDLVSAYRALLGPGLAAKMSMQQLVDFVVTGVNAVKSIGLQSNQVVQELRDLVAGGIQPASSTLATAIGVTDKDITKIKKEGGDLFGFLMERLSGFEQTSLIYNQTYSGRLDALREGITKLSEQGFSPVFDALKEGFADALNAIGQTETAVLQVNGKMQEITKWKLDPQLVDGLRNIATDMVVAGQATVGAAKFAYEYRDALSAIAIAYAALKTSQITGAIVGGWTERITTARAAMVADAQAAKTALERATADNAVAIGTARRAAMNYSR